MNQEGDVEEKLQKMDVESVKQNFEISFSAIKHSAMVFIAQDSISSRLESVSNNFIITMVVIKSNMLIVSVLIANRFGYFDHQYEFITLFDPMDFLMFLTKNQVRLFNHYAVWIIIFDPGGASTEDDIDFF